MYREWIYFLFLPFVHGIKHCELVNNTNNILTPNIVNVVYLTNDSCESCANDIKRLHELYSALLNADITIKVIISGPIDMPLPSDEFQIDENNIIWKEFGKTEGHVLVFDKCGRFTYEVIRPWSSQRQYVKATILTTYLDQPCGECPESILQTKRPDNGGREHDYTRDTTAEIPVYSKLTKEDHIPDTLTVQEGKVPLSVVMQLMHTHEGDNKTYEHIEIYTGNKRYHGHLERETEDEENEYEEIQADTIIKPNETKGIHVVFLNPNDSLITNMSDRNSYFNYEITNKIEEGSYTNDTEPTDESLTVIKSQQRNKLEETEDYQQKINLLNGSSSADTKGPSDEEKLEYNQNKDQYQRTTSSHNRETNDEDLDINEMLMLHYSKIRDRLEDYNYE